MSNHLYFDSCLEAQKIKCEKAAVEEDEEDRDETLVEEFIGEYK